MSSEPSPEEIQQQLSILMRHKAFKENQRGRLLKYLVDRYFLDSSRLPPQEIGPKPTGAEVLRDFLKEIAETNVGEDTPRQMIKDLRDNVDLYFYRLPPTAPDQIVIALPEGRDTSYEPVLKYRAAASNNMRYLGNSLEAMESYIDLIPFASRIEDTIVRWQESNEQSRYPQELMQRLAHALLQRRQLVFQSITGPFIDENYSHALKSVYTDGFGRFEGKRLHHVLPIMNFTIFYFPAGSANKTTVFFGYGKHSGQDFSLGSAAVFKSDDEYLVKEYKRLFKVLWGHDFSSSIKIDDADFTVTRVHSSDVLATFGEWPSEIAERMEQCKESVKICISGWSQLVTYLDSVTTPVRLGKPVTVAVWNENCKFIEARDLERANTKATIAENISVLKPFAEKYDNLCLRKCDGWCSVAVFWIDEYIYFGLYWLKGTLRGPFFLVNADSKTGKYLQEECNTMIKNSSRIV